MTGIFSRKFINVKESLAQTWNHSLKFEITRSKHKKYALKTCIYSLTLAQKLELKKRVVNINKNPGNRLFISNFRA
jgi:hypothetical protein